MMTIRFFDPLSSAWNRMKKALFQPFNINKWFAVGFTAFLAGLTDFHKSGDGDGGGGRGRFDFDEFIYFPQTAWEWLMDNPGWFMLIVFGIVFLIGIGILFTWLSSRGKFMFLDNVIHDRSLVVKPWHEYAEEGNSLFIWRLIFGVIAFAAFITVLVFWYFVFYNLNNTFAPESTLIMTAVFAGLMMLSMGMITAYISLFLTDFVVPIMYKGRISANQAWHRFFPVMTHHFLYFLLYGFLILLFYILIVVLIILGGLFTCCIGFLLLIIPYINSVILLPFSYTLRAFSVEFLGQFGPEFSLFEEAGS